LLSGAFFGLGLVAVGWLVGTVTHSYWIERRGGSYQEGYQQGWDDRGRHEGWGLAESPVRGPRVRYDDGNCDLGYRD
jgi:hypothetical protein